MIVDVLAEGLLEALQQRRHLISQHLQVFTGWLREAVRPPPGVRLVADDGATYSGCLIVLKNELIWSLMHPGPVVSPPPRRTYYENGLLNPDDPRWDRDLPFRR